MEGYQQGGEGGRMEEKAQGIRSINWQVQNRQGVKNCIGDGDAKELICTTHGHELKMGWGGENAGGEGYRAEEDKGEKKRDNCNSIINKYI